MSRPPNSGFYVAMAAEVDEDHPVADIVFDGDHLASAALVDGEWVLTMYDSLGAGERRVPLDGLIAALQEAATRLA